MPRNGRVRLNNLVVMRVLHVKAGTSRIEASKDDYSITIEKSGAFPDDMHVRPDGLLDVSLDYDPK